MINTDAMNRNVYKKMLIMGLILVSVLITSGCRNRAVGNEVMFVSDADMKPWTVEYHEDSIYIIEQLKTKSDTMKLYRCKDGYTLMRGNERFLFLSTGYETDCIHGKYRVVTTKKNDSLYATVFGLHSPDSLVQVIVYDKGYNIRHIIKGYGVTRYLPLSE